MPETPKNPSDIILPPPANTTTPEKICHRFFAPVVIPEPDRLKPGAFNIIPRLGNFPCAKAKCMLWNDEQQECWDVSAARGQALTGDYAYGKSNDVMVTGQP